jgi:hypothetical protein
MMPNTAEGHCRRDREQRLHTLENQELALLFNWATILFSTLERERELACHGQAHKEHVLLRTLRLSPPVELPF